DGIHVHEAPAGGADGDAIVTAIRLALETSAFRVVFQPIVSLRGDEDERFQALLRLPAVEGRTYAAGELVPVAERAGLIADIDRWVLGDCIRTLGERARLGHAVRLFVSQSMASARETDRAEWLRRQLEQHRVPASQLILELRAEEAFAALSHTVAFALAMKQIGTGVAISGFDGGARGYEMLSHLPIDYIKLTARFARAGDEALRKELRELVKLAHAGGRRVIAPRVEDARATAALWSDGVDLIQGNFVRQADRDLSYDFHAAAM
ncbi:MAG: EAL domain-containing protein, partial [Dokdonella sp.]|nr:EAL domain-containing protein [Dokdonella sp.]